MSETDILLAELFRSNAEMMMQIFFGFVSATSAFLVVAHTAGKEMTRALTAVTVTLYVVTSAVLIGGTNRQALVVFGLRDQMKETGVMQWHPAVYEASWIFPTIMHGIPLVELLLCIGAVWYFFHSKKTHVA